MAGNLTASSTVIDGDVPISLIRIFWLFYIEDGYTINLGHREYISLAYLSASDRVLSPCFVIMHLKSNSRNKVGQSFIWPFVAIYFRLLG